MLPLHLKQENRYNLERQDRPWYIIGASLADHLGDIKGKLSQKEKEAISEGFRARFADVADPEVLQKADEVSVIDCRGPSSCLS
jgi:hypothetical protein